MVPSVGDILQVIYSFTQADGGIMQNIFLYEILNVTTSDWDDVAQDIAFNLNNVYDPWMDEVANTVLGHQLAVALRNVALGQWDTVHQSSSSLINGTSVGDTGPPTASATVVAYPEVPRHWGFKNFPPAAEGNTVDGQLTALALAALLATGVLWVLPFTGTFGAYQPGVYSLATEAFRQFTGSLIAGTAQGTRVTRKTGRGI